MVDERMRVSARVGEWKWWNLKDWKLCGISESERVGDFFFESEVFLTLPDAETR